MAKKRPATIEIARRKNNRVLRLNHLELLDEDIEWLAATERLTLWCVKAPNGLLARMENLWWLDVRGGSGIDLEVARGAIKLRYLAVNQVRGMRDLSVVSEMTSLRYIMLYGLPKVTHLPSFAGLTQLEHASVGQLRGMVSLQGLLQAPRLRELELVRKIGISESDVDGIINHPSIRQFTWFAEDVPVKIWEPIVDRIGLPEVPVKHPEEWFELPEFIR